MTTLPPNPTPNEVHVRLLTLLGICDHPLKFHCSETVEDGNGSDTAYWCDLCKKDPHSFPPPKLDDTLLRKARERLLTTEELWEGYLNSLVNQLRIIPWTTPRWTTCINLLTAPILTHAIAICRAVEKGEA